MVKGLARRWSCLRHDRKVKCVDVSLFGVKSGYSPMTSAILTAPMWRRSELRVQPQATLLIPRMGATTALGQHHEGPLLAKTALGKVSMS